VRDEPTKEEVAAAAAYQRLHVPALFGEWTEPVLDAASVDGGHRVLDVACGTGVLARAAHRRVGPGGATVGLDPSPGMLTVAEDLQPAIEWRRGVAEALPFPDASFDRVVSQFGMMFFSDRTAAVREMLRVLVPDGRLAVAVWDALERTPAYAIEVDILEAIAGAAAADALRAPFALGDPDRFREVVEGGGAASASVSTHTGTARFPSIRTMVEADLRGWLPVMGVVLTEEQIRRILADAERELAPFVVATGEVVFDSPAHVAVARP